MVDDDVDCSEDDVPAPCGGVATLRNTRPVQSARLKSRINAKNITGLPPIGE